MDKLEFMEGIHILQNNYNQSFSKDKLKLYYNHLKDMNRDVYLKNINSLINTNKFMPTIAEILRQNNYNNGNSRDYSNLDFNKFYANC